MKRQPDKTDLRRELQNATEQYLRDGGKVKEIPRGCSAYQNNQRPAVLDSGFFAKPRQPRTPVTEVIAALEARRHNKPSSAKPRKKTPRSKVIYDDFGEPIRQVWLQE